MAEMTEAEKEAKKIKTKSVQCPMCDGLGCAFVHGDRPTEPWPEKGSFAVNYWAATGREILVLVRFRCGGDPEQDEKDLADAVRQAHKEAKQVLASGPTTNEEMWGRTKAEAKEARDTPTGPR